MVESTDILRANLDRMRRTEPELAQRLDEVTAAPLQWAEARSGMLTATLERQGRPLALASRYDPDAEAAKLLKSIDHGKDAGVIVLGMALGYHVQQIAQTLDHTRIMVVYEPNLALLRAVLERIDHTAWLGEHNIILADDQMDRAALIGRLEKFDGIVTQGTTLLTHPPSRQLDGAALSKFGQTMTEVLAYCRTTVATTLVNMARTVRNLSLNLHYYAAGADTNDLYRVAQGFPAVCVGAGPSLARNVDLLKDPDVRRNVVLISTQTTLKPLLDRGIRPDFVTALDYHEISKRFYEDLPDLPDVTLVAEPKANPGVLDGYPGPIRVTRSKFLDKLLGELTRPIVPIPAGATVAHLSFYLAQHLGCDPIILIGQDLGFSNGLYYCPGTAIHEVWAPELGQFNTLEMMEWQRIVRHRGALERAEDVHGQSIFTDEQMLTYLKQFERDFVRAPQTVIDATEGGLAKEHARQMTFKQALGDHATRLVPPIPTPDATCDVARLEQVAKLLDRRLKDIAELRRLSVQTIELLRRLRKHQRDRKRSDDLYGKIQSLKQRVDQLQETFSVINDLNSVGSFKRARADRAIQHADGDPFAQQTLQIERDLDNLDWLVQTCDEAREIFTDGQARIDERRAATGDRLATSAML
jgi:hypothetical protein